LDWDFTYCGLAFSQKILIFLGITFKFVGRKALKNFLSVGKRFGGLIKATNFHFGGFFNKGALKGFKELFGSLTYFNLRNYINCITFVMEDIYHFYS